MTENAMTGKNAPKAICRTSSEEETLRLGRVLGRHLAPGTTVLLYGDLGAGKTALVRGVGEALGASRVRSPSFTLVNEYRTNTIELAHADLYRLEPGGVEELALEEYPANGSVLLVEWAERWDSPPRDEVLKIEIEIEPGIDMEVAAEGETGRRFAFFPSGAGVGLMLEEMMREINSDLT